MPTKEPPVRALRRWAAAAAGLLLAAALAPAAAATGTTPTAATAPTPTTAAVTAAVTADPAYRVLVFTHTGGFRHDSIPDAIAAVRDLGAANNFTVDATEDPAAFTTANLARYQAVVFLSTTGDVLDAAQQSAFEGYIGSGGGYVGVHAAADTEYDWPFYGGLAGAWFASHPAVQQATVRVEDQAHPAAAGLPAAWNRTDEWYNYRTDPRSTVHVLASLDESTYSGGSMGDHPISWCQDYRGGRAFYTGLGHTRESYADAAFRTHLLGGIRWAAGVVRADCRPETGYTPLFDGSGTTGWKQAGPGSFTLADRTLTSQGGLGMLWYAAKEFGSYSLKADWRLTGDDNSGVFVGFPASDDPWSAVNNGYEIQIDATDSADRTTGSVYGSKSADLAARDGALNPPGAWNTYEIRVEGEHLQVWLNGVKINDFTNTDPARSLAQGYIGLQNHGDADHASFRNVRIKDLGTVQPPAEPTGPVRGPAGKCLDVAAAATADGTQVQLWTCNATNAQQWTVRTDGTFRALGKCLDVSGGGAADGTKVQLWTCNGTGAQRWTPTTAGELRNPQSGKCLDVTGGNTADATKVQLWTCNGGTAQKWTLPA
ncbi:lectin [Kitasatospora indigofera]|uniref:lectin n=1 Tax=Kitasatospora indigofera TaxID=67307 RepID=UPI00368526A0